MRPALSHLCRRSRRPGPSRWSGLGRLLLPGFVGGPWAPWAIAATLEFSTYFGGSQYEGAYAVAVDSHGNVFLAGSTASTNDFPRLHALQPDFGGGDADAFLARFDRDGRLVFSTFFGGAGYDAINALAIDREGNLVVAGETRSVDLPTTEDALQPEYAGGSAFGSGDGFLARFSPDGVALLHCSYFGGSGDDKIADVAVDPTGGLCFTGQTDSRNLPVRGALQPGFGGGDSDGFVARLDPALTNLVFCTYLGGEDRDEDPCLAVDPTGAIHVGGQTLSTNFPVTAGAFQTRHLQIPEHPSNWDGFIAKFSADGARLMYSTYVGDATGDAVFGIAADETGSAYVTGYVSATWDPGTFPLGFQPLPGYGFADAWVARLKPDGSNFEWFSYLGGFGEDYAYGLALGADRSVFVTGVTGASNFPTRDAPQVRFAGGGQDAFVAKVSPDGQRLIYATFLGGSGEEWGYRLAVDGDGNVLAVGQTEARDFPVREAFQSTNASLRTIVRPADATLVKLTPATPPPALKVVRSGLNAVVTWPTNAAEFALESAASLGPAAAWTRVATVPKVTGNQWSLTLRAAGPGQFLRLRKSTESP